MARFFIEDPTEHNIWHLLRQRGPYEDRSWLWMEDQKSTQGQLQWLDVRPQVHTPALPASLATRTVEGVFPLGSTPSIQALNEHRRKQLLQAAGPAGKRPFPPSQMQLAARLIVPEERPRMSAETLARLRKSEHAQQLRSVDRPVAWRVADDVTFLSGQGSAVANGSERVQRKMRPRL